MKFAFACAYAGTIWMELRKGLSMSTTSVYVDGKAAPKRFLNSKTSQARYAMKQ
jgi:hypothetical protein